MKKFSAVTLFIIGQCVLLSYLELPARFNAAFSLIQSAAVSSAELTPEVSVTLGPRSILRRGSVFVCTIFTFPDTDSAIAGNGREFDTYDERKSKSDPIRLKTVYQPRYDSEAMTVHAVLHDEAYASMSCAEFAGTVEK